MSIQLSVAGPTWDPSSELVSRDKALDVLLLTSYDDTITKQRLHRRGGPEHDYQTYMDIYARLSTRTQHYYNEGRERPRKYPATYANLLREHALYDLTKTMR
jgi:hypothetical protein